MSCNLNLPDFTLVCGLIQFVGLDNLLLQIFFRSSNKPKIFDRKCKFCENNFLLVRLSGQRGEDRSIIG